MNWSSQAAANLRAHTHLRDLIVVEDDFSRRISLAEDPKFWWRMELPEGADLRFTDFNPGTQSDEVMAASLGMLLGDTTPRRLVFVDLVPGEMDPNAHRITLNKVAQRVQIWVTRAVGMMQRQVADVAFEQLRGKACMVFTVSERSSS